MGECLQLGESTVYQPLRGLQVVISGNLIPRGTLALICDVLFLSFVLGLRIFLFFIYIYCVVFELNFDNYLGYQEFT